MGGGAAAGKSVRAGPTERWRSIITSYIRHPRPSWWPSPPPTQLSLVPPFHYIYMWGVGERKGRGRGTRTDC